MFSILILHLLFLVPDSNALGQTGFEKALDLLQIQKIDEAYTILNEIPKDSPDFISAMVQIQKIHYQRSEWLKFFGTAVFYRMNVLREENKLLENFNVRMLSLEALALGRHCQWSRARQLLIGGINLARKLKIRSDGELEQTLSYLELLHHFPIEDRGQKESIPSPIFSESRYWKISNESLLQIQHPRILRLKIENRCGT